MEGGTRNRANTFFGRRLHWLAAAVCSVVTNCAFAIDRGDSQILYFEPLQLDAPAGSSFQQKSSRTRELAFDAYGRHFVVTLEPNDKLSTLLHSKSGATTDLALYRGQVNGASQSWARISVADGQLQGMLWDGSDLYVIEPVAELQQSLPANAAVDPDATAIFRLDDVVMTPGAASCGSDTSIETNKGSDAFSSMLSELKSSPAIMQAAGATKRIEIAALGDALFMNRFGDEATARAEILRRLNNVDGIFSSQLGIEISVPAIDIGDSLSATTSANSLLNELGDLRKRTPSLYSRGLTHLFTGRNLDGTTVGIAFVGSVCDRQYGAGLTEASSTSWVESLIAAHEIGHSFGAPHDGDSSKACAGTPTGQFLMSPSINGNDKFSACSLNIMQARAATSSCITALASADVEVDANLGSVQQPLVDAFEWTLKVRNAGGVTTSSARAEITLPSELAIDEAVVTGGSCTSGAGHITCELGQIAGGNAATVSLSLHSETAASHAISVKVSAANDSNPDNNQGAGTISTKPEVDLAVSLQAPASTAAGSSFSATLSATNLSEEDADTVLLTIALPAGVTASSATFGGNSCVLNVGSISCSLSPLASGTSATGTVSLIATSAGNAQFQAQIVSGQIDPVSSNNIASTTVSVTGSTMTATQSDSSGGGGGGSTGLGLLALLLGTLGLKNLQPRPSRLIRRA